MTAGSSFLAHAASACRRIATLGGLTAIADAERALAAVRWFEPASVAAFIVSEPRHAAIALALLADRPRTLPGERIAELFPELAGLAAPSLAATHEHQGSLPDEARPTPLLDHVFRAMRHAMAAQLPYDPAWRATLTAALLFSDVAKGGDDALRAGWRARLGVDGAVHNEDSAVLLDDTFRRILGAAFPFAEDARWRARGRALCAVSGLVGMRLRGEVGRDSFAAFHAFLRAEDDAPQLARVWSLMNRCDTSAVRDGLWTPALAAAFAREEEAIASAASIASIEGTLLAERVARFRRGALFDIGAVVEAGRALDRLGTARALTERRLERCRTWYAEAALGALSLEGAVRLLALLAGVGARLVDTSEAWHLDLLAVVPHLREPSGAPRAYPVRLLETLLAATSEEDLVEGRLAASPDDASVLVSFPARRGADAAVLVSLDEGDEARALLTLLPIYERKSAAAFHSTLKALCDHYGLRKDDFDRVANEPGYLAAMNAARSDKARMVELALPGRVVEVGPGGGVVLDLLADRFPDARVIGLDASIAAVEALRRRQSAESRRWEVVHGDAFRLGEIFGPRSVDTVIFCSVLHEVYSYVAWASSPGAAACRFSLGSVDAIVAAAFRALRPGGRIVVRDGVMPKREPREVEFLDPSWREGLELFARSYEPRAIPFDALSSTRVRIDAADLYEFLTTYTWGPASFPYEIREQRAVLTRGDYVARMIAACALADPPHVARELTVPEGLASYLQPAYPEHVRPHLRIFDLEGREVAMPNVNGVWGVEKVALDDDASRASGGTSRA